MREIFFPHAAPEYSRDEWLAVKETLGYDFPNVRCCYVFVCAC